MEHSTQEVSGRGTCDAMTRPGKCTQTVSSIILSIVPGSTLAKNGSFCAIGDGNWGVFLALGRGFRQGNVNLALTASTFEVGNIDIGVPAGKGLVWWSPEAREGQWHGLVVQVRSTVPRLSCPEACRLREVWWARQDLNLGPTDYESAALTAELRALSITYRLR